MKNYKIISHLALAAISSTLVLAPVAASYANHHAKAVKTETVACKKECTKHDKACIKKCVKATHH